MVSEPWKVVNLALSGSGVLAIMQAGAVAALRQEGYQFANIAGTSGGAIVGVMVAAGMSDAQIHEVISSIDYSKFLQPARWYVRRLGVVGKIISEGFDVGIYKLNHLENLVDHHLGKMGIRTWGDLKDKIAAGKAINLAVVAVNEENYITAVFPTFLDTHVGIDSQNQPISHAIGCSSAIPNVFVPRVIRGRDGKKWHFIDGGYSEHLPYNIAERMDPERKHRTIGILVSGRERHREYPARGLSRFFRVNLRRGTIGAGSGNFAFRNSRAVADNTLICNSDGVSMTDFSLTPEKVQSLYLLGYQQAKQWIQADLASRGKGSRTTPETPLGTAVRDGLAA